MNRSMESILRFVNLSCSGLLAGSLGFGNKPLTPGWEGELTREEMRALPPKYYNAIGPLALATSLGIAIAGDRGNRSQRLLDLLAAAGFAGVVATTTLGTVPINRRFEESAPKDYPVEDTMTYSQQLSIAHTTRTALGVTAFLCAAAAAAMRKR